MESEGLLPVPVFINGVEAHTVVRDQFTSEHEQQELRAGRLDRGTMRRDAVKVDALVSTIGFPLVGGPAGGSVDRQVLEVCCIVYCEVPWEHVVTGRTGSNVDSACHHEVHLCTHRKAPQPHLFIAMIENCMAMSLTVYLLVLLQALWRVVARLKLPRPSCRP